MKERKEKIEEKIKRFELIYLKLIRKTLTLKISDGQGYIVLSDPTITTQTVVSTELTNPIAQNELVYNLNLELVENNKHEISPVNPVENEFFPLQPTTNIQEQ